tara:strand:+ start:594 stop:983 length:390 start_codon:yes stop_codon:yes gene_type:complete
MQKRGSKYYFKFEDLQIYQKAILFGESVNTQIKSFPKEETYRLASQFIRAADSIALNIAEGSASSEANFNRYLQIAWDSAHECVVCSTKAKLRNFISEEVDEENRRAITELSKMITSYKNYLKKKLNTK